MTYQRLSTQRKVHQINQDPSIYGTFAEIGAGQEVARHFFQAGHASYTVAKTISAYDMTFSDQIYGPSDRYVSQERVLRMLDHEYELLVGRLGPIRGDNSRFFALANTAATGSRKRGTVGHCWMGVRFQTQLNGPVNEIVLHARMRDSYRLQQQEALGQLGTNLLYAAYFYHDQLEQFVSSLLDNLGPERIEVDFVRVTGEDFSTFDNRLLSLELVLQGLTNAVVFGPQGEVLPASDTFFGKPLVVQRGTYRPVTNTNLEILNMGTEQLQTLKEMAGNKPQVLLELSMQSLTSDGSVDKNDFLDRVDTLAAVEKLVLVSNFRLFYELKSYLRQHTNNYIALVIGASHLEKLMNEEYYQHLKGGILTAFGELFDPKTKIYVFPYKSENLCTTAQTFHPPASIDPLYQYLRKNNLIVDLFGCDDVDTSIHSGDVRKMLAERNPQWEKLVPPEVRELIKKRKLFGYA